MKTLPKLDCPTYELTLPSNDAIKLTYRPFLMKEEKILLMALESKSKDQILAAIKRVLQNTIVSPEDFDVDNLTSFDMEYLFLQLRARSIGETIEPKYRCNNIITVPEKKDANGNMQVPEHTRPCSNELKLAPINILQLKPEADKGHNRVIKLTPTIGLKMKYPKLGIILQSFNASEAITNTETSFDFLTSMIECIFNGEEIINPADVTREEMIAFFESMTKDQIEQITNFFNTIPKMKYDTKTTCGRCGFEHSIHLEGLEDFFD